MVLITKASPKNLSPITRLGKPYISQVNRCSKVVCFLNFDPSCCYYSIHNLHEHLAGLTHSPDQVTYSQSSEAEIKHSVMWGGTVTGIVWILHQYHEKSLCRYPTYSVPWVGSTVIVSKEQTPTTCCNINPLAPQGAGFNSPKNTKNSTANYGHSWRAIIFFLFHFVFLVWVPMKNIEFRNLPGF